MEQLTQVLGWIATFLFTFMLTPQIIKTIKRRTVDDISIEVSIIALIANVIALIYSLLIQQPPLTIKYILGIITTLIFMYIYFKYKGKESKIRNRGSKHE